MFLFYPLFNCDDTFLKEIEKVLPKDNYKVLCSNPLFTSDDSILKGSNEEFPKEEGKAPSEVLNLQIVKNKINFWKEMFWNASSRNRFQNIQQIFIFVIEI